MNWSVLSTCAAASWRTRCLMLDFTVMLALTSSSRALTAANSWKTEWGTIIKTWQIANKLYIYKVKLNKARSYHSFTATVTAAQKLRWRVMRNKVLMYWWQNFYFFTSMKLLFHSLAWILRTAWPEKLWRGHWNRTQRADPKRQSWRKKGQPINQFAGSSFKSSEK